MSNQPHFPTLRYEPVPQHPESLRHGHSLLSMLVLAWFGIVFPPAIPNADAAAFTIHANGPYEVWGGDTPLPDVIDYYAAPTLGYTLVGQASGNATFSADYAFFVIGTTSLYSLDAIEIGSVPMQGPVLVASGNVHRPYQFDANGYLIGNALDYASVEYLFGPPDGLTEDVGIPPGYNISGPSNPFDGFVTIAPTSVIDGVEITQATQTLQTLEELAANGPDIPLIAGKSATVRVYLKEVPMKTSYFIGISGIADAMQEVQLDSNCAPEAQRRGEGNCQSANIRISATPSTPSSITVSAYRNEFGTPGALLDRTNAIPLNPVSTQAVRVMPIRICDSRDGNQAWKCAETPDVNLLKTSMLPAVKALIPAATLEVSDIHPEIRIHVDTANYFTNGQFDYDAWWNAVMAAIESQWTALGKPQNIYALGLLRSGFASEMFAQGDRVIDGGVLWTPTSSGGTFERAGLLQTYRSSTLAHELFHMFNRQHTGVDVPVGDRVPPSSPTPGCWGTATPYIAQWPWPDNTIQDVGFNVDDGAIKLPTDASGNQTYYELMSYCGPRWVSPFTYDAARVFLELPQQSAQTMTAATAQTAQGGSHWLVSGRISETEIHLDPVFQLENTAPSEESPGSGYQAVIRDAGGSALLSHEFSPSYIADAASGSGSTTGLFAELIPVQANAASILIQEPGGLSHTLVLAGQAAPAVSIVFPAGGETLQGKQELIWQVTDPDSTTHSYRLEYSSDDGATWRPISAALNQPSQVIDFGNLPGAQATARIRVTASDGALTGSASSNAFSVDRKPPVAALTHPQNGSMFDLDDLVWLQSSAYDPDDGYVPDSAVIWVSDLDGVLGNGADFPTTSLSAGTHTITVSATDADGNIASDAIEISVGLDSDGDGLTDVHELSIGTNPQLVDTDGDGLVDGPDGLVTPGMLPGGFDTNGDGFIDGEKYYPIDPRLFDSDGDLIGDGVEAANNSNPTDPNSWPDLMDGDLAPYGAPDGLVNAADVLIAMRLVLGDISPRALEYAHGDMNVDGTIDIADLVLITRAAFQ